MKLDFKLWFELFGRAILDDPIPSSEIPRKLNNGAMPTYDLEPLPGNKKPMKKMKKNN